MKKGIIVKKKIQIDPDIIRMIKFIGKKHGKRIELSLAK